VIARPGSAAGAVTASVVAGRLAAVVDEMAIVLKRTAASPRLGVRRQFGCALLAGEAVVAADNPRYLATLEASALRCIEAFEFDLEVDDVILTNDPYSGTPTIHHVSIVGPIGVGRELPAFVAVQAHFGDVGGIVMGNYDPDARELRAEGVRFTPLRIVKSGRARRDVLDTIVLNSRMPETFERDLEGMLAAVSVGRRRFARLADAFGLEALLDAMRATVDYAERRMRGALSRIPEGVYGGLAELEAGGYGREPLRVAVSLARSGERTTLDFRGSDAQSTTFVNCTAATTRTLVMMPLLGLCQDPPPFNSGLLRAIELVLEEGSVVAARYPAPTGWSFDHVGHEVVQAVRAALAEAMPAEAGPGWPSRNLLTAVRKEQRVGTSEEQLGVIDLAALAQPGAGGAWGVDGWGQPGPEALGLLPSAEEFEQETGLTIRRMEYRCDSAGAGRWRGAPGVSTVIAFPRECAEHLYAQVVNATRGVPGLAGGLPGSAGSVALRTEESTRSIAGTVTNLRLPGEAELTIDAAGGSGFGHPSARPKEHVSRDVLDGHVSLEAARETYGVQVDEAAARRVLGVVPA
jgi:N-methylhydantoinase B